MITSDVSEAQVGTLNFKHIIHERGKPKSPLHHQGIPILSTSENFDFRRTNPKYFDNATRYEESDSTRSETLYSSHRATSKS